MAFLSKTITKRKLRELVQPGIIELRYQSDKDRVLRWLDAVQTGQVVSVGRFTSCPATLAGIYRAGTGDTAKRGVQDFAYAFDDAVSDHFGPGRDTVTELVVT